MKKKASLRQKVYTSLRFDIVSGKLPGGTRITENFIADALKVSRTPVREALQKLAQEKLILSIPKAGYLIEDLSDNDIQDLFTTRMEIEQIAFHKAIDYITLDELKNLDNNLEATKAAIKSGEDFKITELDIEFHAIIYRAARSKALFRVCKNLSDLTTKYRHGLNLVKSLPTEMLQHHIQIYQAVLAKDTDKISQALVLHTRHAQSHVVSVMRKLRSDSFSHEDF